MESKEKIALMAEIKQNIIDYLNDELKINSDALKAYDNSNPIQEQDTEIRKMREMEAIKLRDRIHQLASYIAVINRMIPTGN
jgi:hypothetical protein